MVLLVGMAVVAVWRAHEIQQRHSSLEHASAAIASLEHSYAGFAEGQAALAAMVLLQDPALGDTYRSYAAEVDRDLSLARAEALAEGNADRVAALDKLTERIGRFNEEMELGIPIVLEAGRDEVMRMAVAVKTEMEPEANAIRADLAGLVREGQDELAAERAAADRALGTSVALSIAFGAAAFVIGAAAIAMLLVSVVRPLTSLRASVGAIASGDLEARARVSGPAEVASLAWDFNVMVTERQRAEEALRQAQNELETRVEERTADLTTANEELQRQVAERRRAEEALRESEERLRAVVNNVPIVLFALNRDGVFTLAEGKGLEALGLNPGELVGLSTFDVHGDIPQIVEDFRRALAGEAFTRTTEVDGLAFETHCAPIRDQDGEISGVIGVATDVSDRSRADEALRESEAKYRGIFENVQDIFYRTDMQGTIVEISPSVERYGYSREGLIGTSVLDIYDSPQERAALVQELLAHEEVVDYEIRLKAGDARVMDASVSAHLRRGPDGEPVGFDGSIRDITERKRMERALRESEERFRQLAENIHQVFLMTDAERAQLLYVSPAYEEIWGRSCESLYRASPSWPDTLHAEDRERVLEAVVTKVVRGDYDEQYRIVRPDGSIRWIRDRAFPIRNQAGEVYRIAGIAEDITERKRAEEATARQSALVQAMNRVFQEALTCESEEAVARTCLAVAEQLTGSEFGFIGEVNQAGRLDTIALSDPGWRACRMPNSDAVVAIQNMPVRGIWGTVIKDGQPLIANDPTSRPDRVGTPEGHVPITAFLGIPLKRGGKTIGMIAVANKASGYDLADQEDLESLSVAFTEALERKRMEEALRESEAKYRQFFESVQDIFYRTDAQGIITEISPSIQRFGYSREGLIGTPVLDVYENPDERAALLKAVLERGEVVDYEIRLKTGDGSVIDVSVNTHVLHGPDGSFAGVEGALRDITERRRMVEALRESEAKYRGIFENVQDIYYRTDAHGIIIEISPSVERWGYTREGLIGTQVLDVYEDPEERSELLKVLFERGEVADYEVRLKTGDGRVIPTSVSTRLLHGADDSFGGVEGALRDISERKRMEQALQESEEAYRELFDNANDIVYTHDLTGRFTSINRAAERVFGYTLDEALQDNIARIVAPEDLEMAREMILRKARGEPVTTYELETITKDGRRVPVEVSTRLIYKDGKPVGVQGIARDISERKRMVEALREQTRRDVLTGVLNHGAIVGELRNLISRGGDSSSHAVAMIDVDGLKAINDTYGHQVGDAVLVAVAGALARDGAVVGRYGGDEFVALLSGADRDAAERYRQRVLAILAEEDLRDSETNARVPIIASVGLAIYPTEAGRIEELIRLADSAMYEWRRQRPVVAAGSALSRPRGGERAAKMVGEIVPLLTSPGDLNDKLRLVAHRLSVGTGYDAVNFQVFEHSSHMGGAQNTLARVPDELVEAWNHAQRQAVDAPFRQILERTHRPVIVDDPQHDQRLADAQQQLLRAAGLRSAVVAPMIWRNEVIGTLSVASKREAAFGPNDAQFLMAVATQVTAIARMATLVEELQSASTRLVQGHTETVVLLAAAAEAHDQATGLHLRSVRTITEALALERGYGEDYAEELGLAAVLHDIGKIRVPDVVLCTAGQLTDEEWELMKQHTVWGQEFLAERPGFELAATIARSHHERWDGGGYPDGLVGESIPRGAAIVAVADAFDAMTSDRPYRACRSVAAAVREIVACSGAQFSPRVVQALVRLHKRKMLSRLRGHTPAEKAAA